MAIIDIRGMFDFKDSRQVVPNDGSTCGEIIFDQFFFDEDESLGYIAICKGKGSRKCILVNQDILFTTGDFSIETRYFELTEYGDKILNDALEKEE